MSTAAMEFTTARGPKRTTHEFRYPPCPLPNCTVILDPPAVATSRMPSPLKSAITICPTPPLPGKPAGTAFAVWNVPSPLPYITVTAPVEVVPR